MERERERREKGENRKKRAIKTARDREKTQK